MAQQICSHFNTFNSDSTYFRAIHPMALILHMTAMLGPFPVEDLCNTVMKLVDRLQAGVPTAYLSSFPVLTHKPCKEYRAKCTEVSLMVNLPHFIIYLHNEARYAELLQLSAKHASNLQCRLTKLSRFSLNVSTPLISLY